MRALRMTALVGILALPAVALAAGGVLSAEQIRQDLRAQGYTGIGSPVADGDVFRVDASRWGRAEPGLRVEASTGNVVNAPRLTTPQVKAALAAAGYDDVGDVTEHGSEFTATATHDGERIVWKIDATTGAIYPATE